MVVYRASSATNLDLTVTYSWDGDATNGADYITSPSSSVTIAAGEAEATIVVTPIDDRLDEWIVEYAIARLTGDSYVIGQWSNATVTIEDNDVPVELIDMQMDFGFGLTREVERTLCRRVAQYLYDQADDIAWIGI